MPEGSFGTILCITEKNRFSEMIEAAHAKADTLQHFGFVVAAVNVSVFKFRSSVE